MNQNIVLILATGAGIIAGAGGTYVFMPEPQPHVQVRAPTQEEIALAIKADPSLLPAPPAPPALVVPSEEEALAAYRKAYSANPMRSRGSENQLSISLGDCDKSPTGPGVACLTSIKFTPVAQPINRVISYSQSASGDWIAANY